MKLERIMILFARRRDKDELAKRPSYLAQSFISSKTSQSMEDCFGSAHCTSSLIHSSSLYMESAQSQEQQYFDIVPITPKHEI